VGLWNYIPLVAGDRCIPGFSAIPVLYTIAESPLESLLVSLLESLLKSLLESLLESLIKRLLESLRERASHREE
jgi:hypothetical protein